MLQKGSCAAAQILVLRGVERLTGFGLVLYLLKSKSLSLRCDLAGGFELPIESVFVKGVEKAPVAAFSSSWVSKRCTSSYYSNKKRKKKKKTDFSSLCTTCLGTAALFVLS